MVKQVRAQNRHGVKATDEQKPAGFVSWLGLCALGRKGGGEYGIEERGGKKGRGRKEKGLKGSEEERKAFGESLFFLGNPPPRRLLTQGVRLFAE